MKQDLYEDLRDPSYAAAYVNEALLEGDEVVFKTAIADAVRARGVGKVAKRAELTLRLGRSSRRRARQDSNLCPLSEPDRTSFPKAS